jgi:hypothetical protein
MNSISSAGTVFQSASAMIQRSVANVSRDAATVASASVTNASDVLPALIDSRQQLLYTQAGAKLIETANQMMGSLLDIRA